MIVGEQAQQRTNSVAIREYTGQTKCKGHSTFKDSILSDIAREI